MTTSELKSYIDRILGNNIRLLLPSYWWKRAFNVVIDKVDEKIEKSELKTINGEPIVGNGDLKIGVKSVESVEALEKLDAQVGDIATIGHEALKSISISQCSFVEDLDIIGVWDKLTHVNKIEQGVPYNDGSNYFGIYFSTKSEFGTDVIIVGSKQGDCSYFHWYNNSDEREITLEETNKLLKEKEYRVVAYNIDIDGAIIDQTFKLYADFTTADAYIKSDSWEKLSKEYIVSSEEELNALSVENGTIAKVASGGYMSILDCYQLQDGEDAQNDFNKMTPVRGIKLSVPSGSFSNLVIVVFSDGAEDILMLSCRENNVGYLLGGEQYIIQDGVLNQSALDDFNALLNKKDYRYGGCLENGFTTAASSEAIAYVDSCLKVLTGDVISDAYIKGETWTRLLKEGDAVGGGADITIDSELSDTSENPVQNKVVYEGLVDLALAVDDLGVALNDKVDKVNGKQLSTEDFTSALKAKLEGLSNYDDTTIANAISGLETRLNTLVSGDASTAIESFNEIIAFLEGVQDTQDLAGIIAAIEQQIATKQDKIADLETIRSGAAKGATALQSVPSEYITESELNAKSYATTSQLSGKQDTITDLATIRSGAALGATAVQPIVEDDGVLLGDAIGIVAPNDEHFYLPPYAPADDPAHTFAMLSDLQGAGGGGVSQEDFDTLFDGLVEAEEVTAAALNDLNSRFGELAENVKGETVTKETFEATIEGLNAVILENEEITAAAFVDLDRRIRDIIIRLDALTTN